MGLVEEEWIDTLATIDPEEVMCIDFVEEGQTLASRSIARVMTNSFCRTFSLARHP